LPNQKPKRERPKTKQDRARFAQINTRLNRTKLTEAERAELEAERDRLAPVRGDGSLSKNRKPKPGTADNLALVERVEAARKTAVVFAPPFVPDAVSSRERAIRKATNATLQEKAEVILAELPAHALNKLARELAEYLWSEDRSNPKPSIGTLTAQYARHWLSRAPYNLHDIRGSKETVANAVADVYRLVAERDAAELGWFVRRAERLFDAPPTPPVIPSQPIQTEDPVQLNHAPMNVQPEPEAVQDPIARAAANLNARAALVLKTDGWLLRLSQHSSEMHTKIIAALSEELYQTGSVSADFAAKLFNSLRPRALSEFPERRLA
jgi:hypothetical protein